jgi:hypothetical protein
MENYVTTIPYFINKYLPYTEQEYMELKNIMSSITTHIPNDKMGWIWNNHNNILKTNEPQPCSCGSAANHWVRATETIRNFILKVESQP